MLLVAAGVVLVRGPQGPAATRARCSAIATIAASIAAYTLVDRVGIQHAGALTYFVLVLAGPCLVYPPFVGLDGDAARARARDALRGRGECRLLRARAARAAPRRGGAGARRALLVDRDRDAARRATARRACLAHRLAGSVLVFAGVVLLAL